MKVQDIIDALSKLNPNAEVRVSHPDEDYKLYAVYQNDSTGNVMLEVLAVDDE